MSAEEVAAFTLLPNYAQAAQVRRWDEAAKDQAAPTPPFDHFRPLLERLLSVSAPGPFTRATSAQRDNARTGER
jgi:hypothetical protein